MPEYQMLRCSIALAGDREQVVVKHRHEAIMFPELIVLQHIHGDDAVTDVHVVGHADLTPEEVWTRLTITYSEKTVREVFPGARPTVPKMDSTIPICTQPIYVAPPTVAASPEPILKPLGDRIIPVRGTRRQAAPPQPVETEPTPDEIAAHAQDDDPQDISDGELADMGLGTPNPMASGRTGYAGQTAASSAPTLDATLSAPDRHGRRTEANNSYRRAAGTR